LVTTPWEWSFSKCKPRGCHNQLSSKTVCAFHVRLGAKPVGQNSELRTEKGMANGNNLGEIRWMVSFTIDSCGGRCPVWIPLLLARVKSPIAHILIDLIFTLLSFTTIQLILSTCKTLFSHFYQPPINPMDLYSMTFRIFPFYTKLN
jgi:hypothetical protein